MNRTESLFRTRKLLRNQEGQVTTIVALALLLIFGFAALTIDVGRAFSEVENLQRTADLSALSGAEGLAAGRTAAAAEANSYATSNVSSYRPGQPFASSNCEELYVHAADGASPATWTPPPVSCAVPHLLGGTCTNNGGVYSCPQPNPCMDSSGVQFDCVYARAASRNFTFLLAPVIGVISGTRILSAQATAVIGSGAPGGSTLAPWVLVDCPVLDLDGAAIVAQAQLYGCPAGGYSFQPQGWNGTRVTLLLNDGSQGNFQGASLPSPPSCAAPDQGFGGQGGGGAYRNYLEGNSVACPIGPGARMHTQTGKLVGPTRQGLANRKEGGVSAATCENQTAFDNTLSDPDGDGTFTIHNDPNHPNPCLIALAMVVHGNPNAPWAARVNDDSYHGACCVTSLQAPDPAQRFAPLQNGSSEKLVVRRFAYFYITNTANAGAGYQVQGVFLKAVDTANNDSTAIPCTPSSGVCVVKLVK